jgi:hypothetical protein
MLALDSLERAAQQGCGVPERSSSTVVQEQQLERRLVQDHRNGQRRKVREADATAMATLP